MRKCRRRAQAVQSAYQVILKIIFNCIFAGWRNQLPAPGEIALEAPTEQKAQSVVEFRTKKKQERKSIKEMVGRHAFLKEIYSFRR